MKLHLPLPLRSALLAVCAVGILPQYGSAEDQIIDHEQSFLMYVEHNDAYVQDYWWTTFDYQGGENDTITFTGISGHVFYGWYHNQILPIGVPNSPTISFKNYAKVVFTGITEIDPESEKKEFYEAPGILTSYYYEFGTSENTRGVLFENVGEVQITNNTGKLFGGITDTGKKIGGLMPYFKNVETVTIEHNNSPTYSNLIGNIDNAVIFEGISKGISISHNIGSNVDGDYALLSRGGLTASASGDNVYFRMDENEGSTGISSILSGCLTLNDFGEFSLRNNKISNTNGSVVFGLEEVAFTNVRTVDITGNELRARVGNLLSGSISGVEQMVVENNYLNYDSQTGKYGTEKEPEGLFGGLTITGAVDQSSSLLIADNKVGGLTAAGETFMGRTGKMVIKDFENVEISGNTGGYLLETENVNNFVFKNNEYIIEDGLDQTLPTGYGKYTDHHGEGILSNQSWDDDGWNIKEAEKFEVSNNKAIADGEQLGGAIFLMYSDFNRFPATSMTLNAKSVELVDNAAIGTLRAWGGAIYDGSLYGITFNDCGNVLIRGNYAQADKVIDVAEQELLEGALGGAICSLEGRWLEFKNNQSVEIRGNYITDKETYQLNAIWGQSLSMMVKAGAGDTFACYDGITVDELHINGYNSNNPDLEARIDLDTSYTGTVIFSGKYAEDDLRALNPNYTQEDLEKSKTILLVGGLTVYRGTLRLEDTTLETGSGAKAKVVAGTLELDHATLRTKQTFDWPGMVLLVSKPEACVSMKNGSVLELNDRLAPQDVSVYGAAWIPTARFEGTNNIIRSNQLVAMGGTWTFNVTHANVTDPILKIEFEPKGDDTFSQFDTEEQVFDIQFDKSTLKKGKYKLLTYDGSHGRWVYDGQFLFEVQGDVAADDLVHGGTYGTYKYTGTGELPTISGMASSKVVGVGEEEGDVYLVAEDDSIYTLYFNNMNEPEAPARRPSTTLTWAGGNGQWGEGLGGTNPTTWGSSSGVSDLNFYTNDKVVIQGNANIELVGNSGENSVRPDEVEVNNAANEEVVLRGSIGISDVNIDTNKTSLTKKGEGKLTINTANAYTGGTVLEAGTLVAGDANALGVGGVTLNGGTLDMGSQAVGNTVTVKKAASITNGGAYTGKLALDGGTLSGAVNLAQDAELKNGTVAGVLSGKGGVVVSGDVTLSGANTYTGKTTVQSGTLTVSGSVSSKQIEVQSGGTYSGTLAGPGLTVTLAGGTLKGDVTMDGGVALNSTVEGSTVDGKLNLAKGGKLGVTEGAGLSVKELVADGGELSLTPDNSGHLSVDTFTITSNKTTLKVGDDLLGLGAGTYELLTYGTLGSGSSADALELAGLGTLHTRKTYTLGLGEKSLTLAVEGGPANLAWESASTNTWSNEDVGGEWSSDAKDKHFFNGDNVTFDSAGDVPIEGTVTPGSITVQGDGGTTFKNAVDKTGALTGKATLTKEGAGTLDIRTDNSGYSGDIEVSGGTLKVGHEHALGNGKVNIANAGFDGAGHVIRNSVSLSGNSRLKGASGVTDLTFANGSKISGEDGYTLAKGHTLTIDSAGRAVRSAEQTGSSYSGNFTFAGGTLKLNGGAFDLSGATVNFAGPTSLIDLSGWEGLTYGNEYTLAQLKEGNETFAERFEVTMEDSRMQESAHIEVRENGEVVLVIEKPAPSPAVAAALSRDQAAAYNVLAQIAGKQLATGSLAEAANQAAITGNEGVIDQLSGAEIATAISSQMEGNLAHLRRLRATIGSGQSLSSDSSLAAFISGYDDFTSIERDYSGRGYNRTEYGGVFGVETRLGKSALLGLALSAGRARVAPSAAQERYHEDTYRQDLYFVTNITSWLRNTATVGASEHKFVMHRVLPSGLVTTAQDMKGSSFNFSEEIAATIISGEMSSFETFFSLESTYSRIDSFHESGAGTASINADGHDAWATDLSLGVRSNFSFTLMGDVPAAMLSMQAALVSSVGDTGTDVTLRYAGAPDMPYSVRAAKHNRWGYSLGASLTVPVSKSTAIFGSAETVLRGDSHETTGSVGIRMSF